MCSWFVMSTCLLQVSLLFIQCWLIVSSLLLSSWKVVGQLPVVICHMSLKSRYLGEHLLR